RDPLSVRRKARINVARRVGGQALDVRAVIVAGPHVAHKRKGDATLVIRRVAGQLGFAAVCGQGTQQGHGKKNTFHEHTSLERTGTIEWRTGNSRCYRRLPFGGRVPSPARVP